MKSAKTEQGLDGPAVRDLSALSSVTWLQMFQLATYSLRDYRPIAALTSTDSYFVVHFGTQANIGVRETLPIITFPDGSHPI